MDGLERYSRQILFKPIGKEGQVKLLESRAAVVGMGALGTVIANHLARSGVGFFRMIDRDLVELSNLQRQTLYTEEDARKNLPKAVAAAERLRAINSEIEIVPVIADLTLDNADELLSDVNVIVDGTDNFSARYLINDISVKYGIPWVYGGAVSSRGMFAAIVPGKTPCYRCLFPDARAGLGETCDTIGVLSPITEIIGSFEAMEALKLLVGAPHNPNLEQIDIWYNSSLQMDISNGRNPECPACGKRQFDFLDRSSDRQTAFTALCGRDTVQINPRKKTPVELEKLTEMLRGTGTVTAANPFLVKFSPNERINMVFFKDGRVLIHGTNDLAEAKSYFARYGGL